MNVAPDTPKVLIFTATYNEADNICVWLERVRRTVPEATILVVDDSSPDGTASLIVEFASRNKNVELISRPAKSGLGSAHKLAFDFARQLNFDVLITMDADLSHDPEQAPELIASLARFDFVIGTRWGLGTCEYRGFRRIVSWSGNFLARSLLRAGVSEYTTSYRAFNQLALDALKRDEPDDDGYAFFVEVVWSLHKAGIKMTEVPITFHDRAGGTSKIPKGQIAISSLRLFQLALKRN